MGKTRADIQRAYRERKKAKEGAGYMRRETQRVKGYYKPTTELDSKKLKHRREKIRNCMRQYRAKSRQASKDISHCQNHESDAGPCDSTTDTYTRSNPSGEAVVSTSSTPERLVVNMKFIQRRGQWSQSKALKGAKAEVKVLKEKVCSLTKRNATLRKRLFRSCTASRNKESAVKSVVMTPRSRKRKLQDQAILTPKSKADAVLRSEGLSPIKFAKLRKELTFKNVIMGEVQEKVDKDRGRARQRSSLQIVCGKLLKRYRLGSLCSKTLGVRREQVAMSIRKKGIRKHRLGDKKLQIKESVVSFMERDDNSTCMPGKRDAKKTKTGKIQVRVLNDYLYNLHLKFVSENQGTQISRTTFASYRPSYIKLVQYSSRRTCLCQKHQNITLKMKGLKSIGAITTDNPDMLIRQNTDNEILKKIADCEAEAIKFSEWKRKEINHKGKISKRMMIESIQLSKVDFIEMFRQDLCVFRKHVDRVKCQYKQIKILKDRLPNSHVICQMDFAENYSCGHADEIQTAYFDKCSVTLHPVVLYTRDESGIMKHNSYIYVSDTQSHSSGTVYAIIKQIINDLKTRRFDIQCIHFITDSPTSQYRNKAMMYVVANHDKLFGMAASWQYWEAGHGKGPCDGVGGTSKRQADLAVKRHTAVIQSSFDYYNWGCQSNSQTKYYFVSKEECDYAHQELSLLNIKPIKGTMDIHSVVHITSGEIAVRNTSCFCEECFKDGLFTLSCPGWTKHSLKCKHDASSSRDVSIKQTEIEVESAANEVIAESTTSHNETSTTELPCSNIETAADLPKQVDDLSVNRYVAAVYNDRWYVGKIIDYDFDDDNLPFHVRFMEHGKGKVCHTFKWPGKEDSVWMQRDDILCAIEEPVTHGTRKMFKLPESEIAKIINAFEKYK